jgi:hypothetical protein
VLLTRDLLAAIRGDATDRLFATFDDGLRLMQIARPILQRFYDRS